MDAELRTMIEALVNGQIKLAEGQAMLAERQARTEASIERLAAKMEASIDRLAERLDGFGAKVVRGFTQAAQSNGDLELRVTKLESEVESLKSPSPQDS